MDNALSASAAAAPVMITPVDAQPNFVQRLNGLPLYPFAEDRYWLADARPAATAAAPVVQEAPASAAMTPARMTGHAPAGSVLGRIASSQRFEVGRVTEGHVLSADDADVRR